VLLMDEPSAGLTTAEVAMIADRIRGLAASGVAVFVVAHDMNLMNSVCDRVHVMHLGRIIASGTPAEISADPQVRAAYFGDPAGAIEADEAPAAAMPAAPKVLEMYEVVAGYGGVPALNGVSLALPAGRVHALLGPNGAGKSTLVRVASGLLPPTRGRIRLGGRDVALPAPHVLSRIGITAIPERPSVFGSLTVAEHLRLRRGRAAQKSLERIFATFPVLADRRNQLARTLSGGEQQMLAVGRALASDPAILVVDEPSNGLAPRVVGEVYGALRKMAAGGTAVLLVEQYVEQAMAIADEVTLLRAGRVLFAGRAHLAAAELPRAYLGG
jgi:ABC-type branched-subunit amino acid transport system ATPase component